jgi:hypothetical protein
MFKLQLLQDPSQINSDKQNNLSRDTSRNFRNKEQKYLKGKTNELEINIGNKNTEMYRGGNEFKKGNQSIT